MKPSNSTNTEGVPEPEVSATAQRNATRAFPDDTNWSEPRCYGQCVQGPNLKTDGADDEQTPTGYQQQYTD